MKTQDRKWLIILLIYADFTTNDKPEHIEKLKTTLNNLLGDIITTPIDPDKARIFVIFNSIKFVFNAPTNLINDKSVIYTMDRTTDRTQNCITKCEIIDNRIYYDPGDGGQVLQKPTQLRDVLFKTNIKSDEEVFLITWDHGSSFGMFRSEPSVPGAGSVRMQVEKNLAQYPFLKQFWDFAKEENHKNLKTTNVLVAQQSAVGPAPVAKVPEILKNSELREAICRWLGPERKVGVLLMVNCYMMNLHTMYALKGHVQCLVAPQGSIDCPGYNTKDIFSAINSAGRAGIVPIKLAEVCVTTIENEYARAKAAILVPKEPDIIGRFKIFAVDLSKTINGINYIDHQINLFREIIKLFITELPSCVSESTELKFFLKYIRASCFDFSEGFNFMIDIVNWVQSIQHADSQFFLHNKKLLGLFSTPINKFLGSVSEIGPTVMLESSRGEKVYHDEGYHSTHLATIGLLPTGYSLFFPIRDCSDFEKLKDNILSDDLLKTFPEWRTFLKFIDPEIDNIFK